MTLNIVNRTKIMFPRLNKFKTLLGSAILLYLLIYFGAFTHIFEKDFYSEFSYPLEGDVFEYIRQIRRGQNPNKAPINLYNYSYISRCDKKCFDSDDRLIRPRMMILVKSALDHFDRRSAIRKTWGYEKRFSDVIIRTAFILGISEKDNPALQKKLNAEAAEYNDIVQAQFFDTYFNNTIKTMTGIRWAILNCPRAKFYLFVDDDFYVSIKNMLKFIRSPVNYPEYLEEAEEVMRKVARRLSSTRKNSFNQSFDVLLEKGVPVSESSIRQKRYLFEYELADDVRLFTGFVFKSSPHRHRSSKWYISLEEYPWHMWPTYVTSGAFILSREALHDMYYASMYTQHFRFDDIFLGLVAMKAHIEPLHSDEFYFHKAAYSGPHSYKYTLASHGYSSPQEMQRVWNEVRSGGYA